MLEPPGGLLIEHEVYLARTVIGGVDSLVHALSLPVWLLIVVYVSPIRPCVRVCLLVGARISGGTSRDRVHPDPDNHDDHAAARLLDHRGLR